MSVYYVYLISILYYRYASLDESDLSYDNDMIGHAIGVVRYDIPVHDPNQGLIGLTFDITDGNNLTVTASNYTVLVWSTNNTWQEEGTVVVVSQYDLFDGNQETISWDAIGSFDYGQDMYTLYAVENPIHVSRTADTSSNNNNNNYRRLQADLYDMESLTPSAVSPPIPTRSQLTTIIAPAIAATTKESSAVTDSTSSSSSSSSSSGTYTYDDQFLLVGLGNYGGSWSDW
jgi:hypothetical protein